MAALPSSPLADCRLAAGYTQESFADKLGVDRTTVGRWERGVQGPQPWQRPDLATALSISLDDLDDILRRTKRAAGRGEVVVGGLVNGDFTRPAISGGRVPIGSADHIDEVLHHLREQWHALVKTDNLLGPRFALATVLDHIVIIDELLPVTTGSARFELVTLGATYAESAAWLHEDGGRMPAAVYWTARAMEWAHEGNDRLLVAWTLFRRSQHAAVGGDAQQTISLARAAGRDGDRLPAPMRAAIAQQEAQGYALEGNEVMAHRALDQAHHWAAVDTAGDARAGHGSFCTETYLELQRAYCWLTLGRPDRAIQLYDAVLPSLPTVYRRDRGVACSRFAQAYAATDQPEAAAALGREALEIARGSGSVRTKREVVLLGHQLGGYRHLAPVASLLHDLALAA